MTNAIVHQNNVVALKEPTVNNASQNVSDESRIVAKTGHLFSLIRSEEFFHVWVTFRIWRLRTLIQEMY